jgi:chemotaxis protein MotB
MRLVLREGPEETTNPFIALADVGINLVLVLIFFVAAVVTVSHPGWEPVRYLKAQREFREALADLSDPRPREIHWKNDPPGTQRWTYANYALFKRGNAELVEEGRGSLIQFARLLRRHKDKWRRIQIEGHTMPPRAGGLDDWELSTRRAAVVARIFVNPGSIDPWFLKVSGRAGQNPLDPNQPDDQANERVEIVIEYARKSATGEELVR